MLKLPVNLCLLLAVCSTPAVAETGSAQTVQASTAAPVKRELALELARVSQPKELLVEAVLKGFDQAAAEEPDEEMAAIEKEFPGFLGKVRVRGRAELASLMTERAPVLQQRIADVYAAEVAEEHIRSLITFMKSPTGSKLLRTMTLAPSTSSPADDLTLTKEEVAQETRSAAAHSLKQMSGDENIELIKFAVSPAGQANRRVAPKIQEIVATGMTEIMTEFTARMEPITVELLEAYGDTKSK